MAATDFAKVVPIVHRERNVIINRNGDMTLCFTYSGVPLCAKSREQLEKLDADLTLAFTYFSERVVFHKQDVYTFKKFEINASEAPSFLSKAYYQVYEGKEYLSHTSYIFITKTQALSTSRDYQTSRKGKDITEKSNGAGADVTLRGQIEDFENECSGMIRFMSDCGMQLKALSENEADEAILGWFSLYDDSLVCDIDLENREIGFNNFNMVAINSGELLPEMISSVRLNSKFKRYSERIVDERGDREVGLYSSFFGTLGYDLNCPHVVNQIFYLDGKNFWRGELEKQRKNFGAWSLFSPENKITFEHLKTFEQDTLERNETVVRFHFNILFWSDKETLKKGVEEVRSKLKELGITGYVPARADLQHIYLASCAGNAGTMPSPETFLGHASAMTALCNKETVEVNASLKKKGLLFTDRNSGVLIKRDCWHDVYLNGINNRNWIGVGKSGSGKSSASIEIIRQYYEMGFNSTILDIGRSFEVLAKSHNGNYIIYEDGVELGVNPFCFSGTDLSVEELEFLTSFTATLWKPNEVFSDNQTDALEKVLLAFYGAVRKEKTEEGNDTGYRLNGDFSKVSIKDFYSFVSNNRQMVSEITKNNKEFFDHDSFSLGLEKFVNGKFDRLLTGESRIDTNKRITVWELDNIKDHPILFPIVSMLIMYLTTNVVWKQVSVEKIVLIEEAWKMLEKPSMTAYIKWLYKTIRKFDGGVGLNIQQAGDLVKSGNMEIKETVLANSDVMFIMSHNVEMAKTLAKILGWDDYKLALLLSIPIDGKKTDGKSRFTEFVSVVGTDVQALRLMVSPEQVINFTSEMSDKSKLFELVSAFGGNWERSIQEFAKLKFKKA